VANLTQNLLFATVDELPEEEGTPFDINRQRSYIRRFLVRVRYKALGPAHVCLCPGIPLAGSFYISGPSSLQENPDPSLPPVPDPAALPVVFDRYAVLLRKTAQRRSNDPGQWPWWIVTCEYGTNLGAGLLEPLTSASDNPEQDLAEISWDYEEAQEAPAHDLNGYPYVNAAKMPFSPAHSVPKNYDILTVTRNELSFNHSKASAYASRLNSKPFLNAPTGCVQIYAPRGVQKSVGSGLRYWRVTYKLKFRPPQRTGGYSINLQPNGGIRMYDKENKPIWFINAPTQPVLPPSGIGNQGTLYHRAAFPDSWQPTVLNKSLYKLGRQGEVVNELIGKSVPIFKNGHPLQHPVILNWIGQEVTGDIYGNIPPWFIRFEDFGYADITTLLVKGVS
jgi:hypothetical protein